MYTVPDNISDIRKKAWETRRAKYGNQGHRGGAYRSQLGNRDKMMDLIIRLHIEGTLSEGQVAKATDLHRIEVRRLADEMMLRDDPPVPGFALSVHHPIPSEANEMEKGEQV